jgi:NADPH2:quinone reductase
VIGRSGSNGQYAVVDARLAGRRPVRAGWGAAECAALPLVGITAWEMLACHFGLVPFSRPATVETLLIVNGAGGVGTMATQLARFVFGVQNIVVTASRPETVEWARANGATHTISHREPLAPQLEKLGLVPSLAFICYDSAANIKQIIPVMRPFGRIGSIVEATDSIGFDGGAAFYKALSFHWCVVVVFSPPSASLTDHHNTTTGSSCSPAR